MMLLQEEAELSEDTLADLLPLVLQDKPVEMALEVQGVSKLFTSDSKAKKKKKLGEAEKRGLFAALKPRPRQVKRVVDNISLSAHRGEALGILGPNGCGKSTLVRIISTLLVPDEGRVLVFGTDVAKDPMTIKRIINRVSVDAAFFKKLSAMENLLYTARLYGLDAKEALNRAREILASLGFDNDNLDSSMEQLSRGQQQKVAIARAFLTDPKLVLLDEPTTGLDPKSKLEVAKFINDLRAKQDITLILTTHDMAEAENLCDRIAILNHGKLVACGTAQQLKERARASADDPLPTLEEVFLKLAGERLEDADEPETGD